MAKSIFREYDIRGIFQEELSEEIVKKIGYFFASEVKEKFPNAKYISVGYDARSHSSILKEWLSSGINKAGIEVLDMGLVATPINYFSNYIDNDGKKVNASIMITGSHNPPEYNGFKITMDKTPYFAEDIYSLGEKVLQNDIKIEDNTKTIFIDTKKEYVDYMIKEFSHLNLKDKSFVFDCGNGAAGSVLRNILEGLN
ncbi:MAG: phosphomannomutase/phosphoglucomutase, partial [Halarcobacter sp.]